MRLVLRHAWLNLWDKHMTTGRINQVTLYEMQEQRGRRRTNPASQAKRISNVHRSNDRQTTNETSRPSRYSTIRWSRDSLARRTKPPTKQKSAGALKPCGPCCKRLSAPEPASRRRLAGEGNSLPARAPCSGEATEERREARAFARSPLLPSLASLARFARTHHTRPHIDKNTNCKRATSCYSTYRFNTYSYFFT